MIVMVKVVIKSLLALFTLYVTVLYWGNNGYRETGLIAVEYHGYLNGAYFGSMMITLFLDISSKIVKPIHYYASIAVYAGIGFLMPTQQGKLMAFILAFILIGFWIVRLWRTEKAKNININGEHP